MRFPPLMPTPDRPLSMDERNRVHAALLEVERTIELVPGDVSGWTRIFSVQASAMAPPGADDVHLIRPRAPKPVAIDSEATRLSLWDRFCIWWWNP